jgi:curved DNA-binding protein CbpA
MNIEDCFQILELKPDATLEEIKTARNELLQVWHPDKFALNSKLTEKAIEKTLKINEAFSILVKDFRVKEQKYKSKTQKKPETNEYQKERERFFKKQEAIFKYKELRTNQINHARRQLNFAILYAFLTGVFGLVLGFKEWTFLLVLVILAVGFLISFRTYRKPIKKSRKNSILR